MPSGKTHNLITATTTPIVGAIIYFSTYDITVTILITLSYIFASLMFNGDLDIKSSVYNRWLFLKWIWYPYREIFPHRSIWTHGIIIGTIIRLLYLTPFIIITCRLLQLEINHFNWNYIIPLLIGLELGNSTHTISDKIL
jgi:uncharacterized metal-binding protein